MTQLPDDRGHFGIYGGRFVPETLMPALEALAAEYDAAKKDPTFQKDVDAYLKQYVGRPTPITFAKNLSAKLGFSVYLKREDLCHTGAHKINNTIGQILLAKRMGKKRVVAETGAGQHGVATATAAALFGMECVIYMGEEDIHRQEINVFRMELLGAQVVPVKSGSRTLKDAINDALRDWMTNVRSTFYVIGSVVGPHPYPQIVRDFQSVIGREARGQILELAGKLPKVLVACVGGGSNAMGLFYPFLDVTTVEMIGVEAEGAAPLVKGRTGVLHGARTALLQTKEGQISPTHSISAGLDYPGVGPEHSYLQSIRRIQYVTVNDKTAVDGFHLLTETEGILPALEPSHAIGYLPKLKEQLSSDDVVLLGLSGRGDKDIDTIRKWNKNGGEKK